MNQKIDILGERVRTSRKAGPAKPAKVQREIGLAPRRGQDATTNIMHSQVIPTSDDSQTSLADLQFIAANAIAWNRRQAEAVRQCPLAYIECLLDQMADANYLSLADIPQELGRFVPSLERDACIGVVSAYLASRPALV